MRLTTLFAGLLSLLGCMAGELQIETTYKPADCDKTAKAGDQVRAPAIAYYSPDDPTPGTPQRWHYITL